MSRLQKIMDEKLQRMMAVLNKNEYGRVYRVKCIDFGDAAYYMINHWFDVEVSPSTMLNEDTAHVVLWRLRYEDNKRYAEEIACVRDVVFADLDAVVQQWVDELQHHQAIHALHPQYELSKVYAFA